jgi:hypothetical protein
MNLSISTEKSENKDERILTRNKKRKYNEINHIQQVNFLIY